MGSFLPQVKCGTTDTTGLACSTGRKDEDGVRITPDSRWPGETLSLPTRPKTPLAQGGRAGTRQHQNRRFWQEKVPPGKSCSSLQHGGRREERRSILAEQEPGSMFVFSPQRILLSTPTRDTGRSYPGKLLHPSGGTSRDSGNLSCPNSPNQPK